MNIMVKNLKNKLKKAKGFTLVEMLIVVAIIAILVAVAAPAVSSNLKKAKMSTDAANFRSAKAVAVVNYMDDKKSTTDIYFDADSGTFVADKNKAYKAKVTVSGSDVKDGNIEHNEKEYIVVEYTADGPNVKWSAT